jgi:hypothetical protein
MPDLTTYVDMVLDGQDRILMQEASNCLAAGARRAAYITVWLACAESLRRKFNEAAVHDHEAAAAAGAIAQLEVQHRAVDGPLIDKAKAYGFITDAEATRLRHLYENRNVFGHPYEESPSDQLVVTAASEAVSIVLGRPVTLREGYLAQQVIRLTTDTTFLADDRHIVVEYAKTVHARAATDRKLYFIRKLLRAYDTVFADPSLDLLQRRAIWFTRAFLLADPAIFVDWDPVDDLPDHPTCLPGILADAHLLPYVSDHSRDIVVNVLVQQAHLEPMYIQMLYELRVAGVLHERHVQQLDDLMSGTSLSRLSASGIPLTAWGHQLVENLAYKTWDVQNDAVLVLRRAGRERLGELEDAQQEQIGRALLAAADGTAYRAINLLAEIATSAEPWPPGLVRGLVLECFAHEDGELRLKTREMTNALRALAKLDDDDRVSIADGVVAALEQGRVRHPSMFTRERDEAAIAIHETIASHALDDLSRITDALSECGGNG